MPYGKSPFAFSAGTVEARCTRTLGVTFSLRFVDCSSGVGDGSTRFECGDVGCRDALLVVFFLVGLGVGRGWKAFEMEWPTFLKKSPTGSPFTHRALKKNSAATGNKIQREQMKDLSKSSAFNVKTGFSERIGSYGKQKILLCKDFRVFSQNG